MIIIIIIVLGTGILYPRMKARRLYCTFLYVVKSFQFEYRFGYIPHSATQKLFLLYGFHVNVHFLFN